MKILVISLFLTLSSIPALEAQLAVAPDINIQINPKNISSLTQSGNYNYYNIVQNENDSLSLQFRQSFIHRYKQKGGDSKVLLNVYFAHPFDYNNNQLISFHFKNNQEDDVYVYFYFSFWVAVSQYENGINSAFWADGIVSFDYLNLQKGTYLVDWINPNRHKMYRKIERNLDKEIKKIERNIQKLNISSKKRKAIQDMNISHNFNRDSLNEYQEKQIIIDEWIIEFLNNDSFYDNLFERKSVRRKRIERYKINYFNSKTGKLRIAIDDYSNELIIKEKAVKKQKISNTPISPKEIETYYKNKDLKTPKSIRKILSVFGKSKTYK